MDSFASLYDILQVPETASPEEIKAAFRKLAKIYHPDKNKNSPGSETAFIVVHNAYKILSDSKKREEYDFYQNNVFIKKKIKAKKQIHGHKRAFSVDELLDHINYFLWDIEIFLTKDYKRCFDKIISGITVKDYILGMLVFIDKWILYPAGICDYFMEARQIKNIRFSDYSSMIDAPSSLSTHRPFFTLNYYFYDIRKRIDRFINKVKINDLHIPIPGSDIRLIDSIIETQNYVIHYMSSLKNVLAGKTDEIEPFDYSNAVFYREE